MDGITLPPDLEQFATDAVASGQYRDTAEVVAAGIRLLQQQQTARVVFVRSLEEAQAESDRDGWFSLDEVMAEADAIIADMQKVE